jgi:hypothetical protein
VKLFADDVQRRGASLSSRVEGDITVQHLTQIEERNILETEYRRAQEQFQHVSRLKKAVDSRTGPARPQTAFAAQEVKMPPAPPAGQSAPASASPRTGDLSSPSAAASHADRHRLTTGCSRLRRNWTHPGRSSHQVG